MRQLCKITIFIGIILCLAVQAWAEFTLIPGITLRQEYDDNIYLDDRDEEDDFITKIIPTLLMKWEGPRIDLSLDVRLMIEKYYDNTDEDRVGPGEADQASTFNALAEIYPEVFFLRVADTYRRVPVDEGERGGDGNNVVNLIDSNTLTVNPYLQFGRSDRLQLTLGYTYENLWYGNEDDRNQDADGNDTGDDAETHAFNVTLTKSLTPRVTVVLSGSRLLYRPKNPETTFIAGEEGRYEYDRDSARAGLNYQVSDRFKLAGGYGHAWLDYDAREDSDASTWDISADYEFSSAFRAGITYKKDYAVTVEDGAVDSERHTVLLVYDDRFAIKFAAFVANSDYLEIDRSDDSYGGDLGGSLPFTDKYGLDWGLRYANYDESGVEEEEYDRYGARLAFYYLISLGRVALGYTWTRNDSDLDVNDYTNNIAYLEASLKF